MTFLLILTGVVLLVGVGVFVWAIATWLRAVDEGLRAKPLPQKSDP